MAGSVHSEVVEGVHERQEGQLSTDLAYGCVMPSHGEGPRTGWLNLARTPQYAGAHQFDKSEGHINVGTHFVATTTTPGENDRLTFTGTAGKRFSLRVFQQSWTAQSGLWPAEVRLLDPAGKTVWSSAVPATPGTLIGPTLGEGGKWSVVIDPGHDSVGSITATAFLK